MARSGMQKIKILYILDILKRESDETHPLSVAYLIDSLERQGIKAERKSIYDDIEWLRTYGYDVIHATGKNGGYFLGERDFELAELKLLVDAVQSSKFITQKRSEKLIRKLSGMANKYDEGQLSRQVDVINRVKSMNESIYNNVDKLHHAMNENREITFKYFEWTYKKEKKLRHEGKLYRVSPWSLCWDDENYYLVSYDEELQGIRHFRVDKMLSITETESKRVGKEIFKEFNSASYSKQVFGMYGGETELVTLRCGKSLAGVMIDRFGTDIFMRELDEDHFETTVKVAVSPPFLSWVFQFGTRVKITSPQKVADKLCDMAKATIESYNENK